MNIPKQTTLSSTGLRQSRLSSQASDNDFTSKVHGQLIIQKTHSGISSPKKQHEDPSSSGSLFEDQPPPPSLQTQQSSYSALRLLISSLWGKISCRYGMTTVLPLSSSLKLILSNAFALLSSKIKPTHICFVPPMSTCSKMLLCNINLLSIVKFRQ